MERLVWLCLLCLGVVLAQDGYYPVPGGRIVHESCIHVVESGTHVHLNDDFSITIEYEGKKDFIPRCEYPILFTSKSKRHGVAWKAYAQFDCQSAINYMTVNWELSSNPIKNGSQLLYFWPGIEPQDNSLVLQPVAQYGYGAPDGGGYHWGYASWLVGSYHPTVVSKQVSANVGDNLFGLMSFQNGSWEVTANTVNGGANSTIYVSNLKLPQRYAYASVLEAYNLDNCDLYPSSGSVTFSNVYLECDNKAVTPTWQALTQNPITCNEHAVIISDSSTQIVFNT